VDGTFCAHTTMGGRRFTVVTYQRLSICLRSLAPSRAGLVTGMFVGTLMAGMARGKETFPFSMGSTQLILSWQHTYAPHAVEAGRRKRQPCLASVAKAQATIPQRTAPTYLPGRKLSPTISWRDFNSWRRRAHEYAWTPLSRAGMGGDAWATDDE